MSKQALGKGFDGLIPIGFDVSTVTDAGEGIKQINIDSIVANPDQPRKSFDEKSLEELAQSIKQHGIIQPLVVSDHEGGKYRIVAGERRWRASQIAGLEKIPAIVRNHKELEEIEIALVENIQRVDLSSLETAVSIVKLRDQFSLTPKQIAKKLGKAETTISNTVRLLQLPKEAVIAMQENTITEGHARTILSLKVEPAKQLELLNTIITQKLSVREAEKLSKQLTSTDMSTKNIINRSTEKLLRTLPEKMQKQVKISAKTEDKGKIVITYKSKKELESYIQHLKK